MTAIDILEELCRIRPDFRPCWNGENYFRDDDGTFTACGVFSQFSDFFRSQHSHMKKEELQALAALIARGERDEFLADAAYTCFLENIAGEPSDTTITPYLSAAAVEFMSQWRPRE